MKVTVEIEFDVKSEPPLDSVMEFGIEQYNLTNYRVVDEMPVLESRELAAVLAGLRLVQAELPRSEFLPQGIQEIYDDAGPGLSEDEIDLLIERLN